MGVQLGWIAQGPLDWFGSNSYAPNSSTHTGMISNVFRYCGQYFSWLKGRKVNGLELVVERCQSKASIVWFSAPTAQPTGRGRRWVSQGIFPPLQTRIIIESDQWHSLAFLCLRIHRFHDNIESTNIELTSVSKAEQDPEHKNFPANFPRTRRQKSQHEMLPFSLWIRDHK